MPHQRVAGIIAALLMVPFVLAGSDLACPRHDLEDSASQVASHATQSMEGHEHAGHGSGQGTAPSEQHPLADCCLAMSTCASSVAMQCGTAPGGASSPRLSAPATVIALSVSRVESPDPPPPKA